MRAPQSIFGRFIDDIKPVATLLLVKKLSVVVVLNDKVARARFRCSTKPMHPLEAAEHFGSRAERFQTKRHRPEVSDGRAKHCSIQGVSR